MQTVFITGSDNQSISPVNLVRHLVSKDVRGLNKVTTTKQNLSRFQYLLKDIIMLVYYIRLRFL